VFHCHVCGSRAAHEEVISEIFQLDGKPVLVEGIPVTVCDRCGEMIFSRETTEKIRQIVHGKTRPIRSIALDVFAFN